MACSSRGGYRHNDIPLFRVRDHETESGFSGETLSPLIQSTSETFRVVDVKTGPDGAIYLADFTQDIIGHYEFSLRDPRRDKSHGRIWRVTAKDRDLLPRVNYFNLSSEELLELLKSSFQYDRYQAKRVLSDRPSGEVIAAVEIWVDGLDPSHPDYDRHLTEALGIFVDHEVVNEDLLSQLLEADHFQARALATGTIGYWNERLENPMELLRSRVLDEHPRVRLHAVVALSHTPSVEAFQLAELAQEQPSDRFLDYALTHAFAALDSYGVAIEPEPEDLFENRLARGERLYMTTCAACHQPGGEGLPGQVASLVDSRWVPASLESLVRIVLHGKQDGEVMMPPMGAMRDSDIADILTYVRSTWVENETAVEAEHVSRIREATAGRSQLWTEEELEAVEGGE